MDRARRVASYWSYLPAFRVVAECEHLPTAAKLLRVSPSALSRSIRLLEHRVGATLFERGDGRLQLSVAGNALLLATRDALRLVDEGAQIALGQDPLAGTVRVAVTPDLERGAALLAASLQGVLPKLRIALSAVSADDADGALLAGFIDVAVLQKRPVHARLRAQIGAALPRAFFARDSACPQSFIAITGGAPGAFPLDEEPTDRAEVASVQLALALASLGTHGVTACHVEAAAHVLAGTLRATALAQAPLELWVVTRRPAGKEDPAAIGAAARALCEALQQLSSTGA